MVGAHRAELPLAGVDLGVELVDEPQARGEVAEVAARDVAAAAAAGDGVAWRTWDETTAILGPAVATILGAFNPELVVLGGGVTRTDDQLLVPVREASLAQAIAPASRSADVVLAELGDRIGVVATAASAYERLPGVIANAEQRATRPQAGPEPKHTHG